MWLSGWSVDDAIFNVQREQLRSRLPAWRHIAVLYYEAETAEQMYAYVKEAVFACRKATDGLLWLVGWSLGGLLALRIVAELGADGLILLGATACFVRSGAEAPLGWPDAYLRQMSLAVGQEQERIPTENRFRAILLSPRERSDGLESRLPAVGRWSKQALLAGLKLLRHEDYRTLLPGITCPVLVVHGLADIVCPFGAARELHQSLAQATLFTVEEGGHIPFLGREAEIADAIRGWWHGR